MKSVVALLRVLFGAGALVAVAATFLDTATRAAINPFNFFGYFTVQSNTLGAIVFVAVGVMALVGRQVPYWLHVIRGIWIDYLIIVGVVYNTLLVGTEGGGGVTLPWANVVLHVIFPIYVLLDWLFIADRPALKWKHIWFVVVYPSVWGIVVLVRGATDGWVPYPFLDPSLGYGSITVTLVGIAIGVLGFGAAVWAISRLSLVRIPDRPSGGYAADR